MLQRSRLLIGISLLWFPLSMLGDGLNTLVLPIYLLAFTDETSQATVLGLVTFIGLLFGMILQPLAGSISDGLLPRRGRRGIIALSVIFILVALGGFGLARSVFAIASAYVAIQIAASVGQSALQGFIPDLVPPQWRGTAAGLKGFMDLSGALLGYVLLGQILSEGVIDTALLAIAVVLLVAFILTSVLVYEPAQQVDSNPRHIFQLNVFRIDFVHRREFIALVVSRFLFLAGIYAVGRFLLYFVADRLRLDPNQAAEQASGLLTGLTLISVLSAPAFGWASDRVGRIPLMVVGTALGTLGVLLLIGAENELQILLFGSLMSAGSAAFTGANWALTTDIIPPSEAARYMALANFGTAGAAAAAGLFGPVIDWVNSRSASAGYVFLFLAAAVTFVMSAAVLRASRFSIKQVPQSF